MQPGSNHQDQLLLIPISSINLRVIMVMGCHQGNNIYDEGTLVSWRTEVCKGAKMEWIIRACSVAPVRGSSRANKMYYMYRRTQNSLSNHLLRAPAQFHTTLHSAASRLPPCSDIQDNFEPAHQTWEEANQKKEKRKNIDAHRNDPTPS